VVALQEEVDMETVEEMVVEDLRDLQDHLVFRIPALIVGRTVAVDTQELNALTKSVVIRLLGLFRIRWVDLL